jgi:hypothetical protein
VPPAVKDGGRWLLNAGELDKSLAGPNRTGPEQRLAVGPDVVASS